MPTLPPNKDECVEALQVMILTYGRRHTERMLKEAADLLKVEAGEVEDGRRDFASGEFDII